MTKLTTHVLDIYSGKPGKGIKVDLYYYEKDNQKSKITTIVLNNDHRIGIAKQKALELASCNYTPPNYREDLKLPGAGGRTAMAMALKGFKAQGKISAHDEFIAKKLAFVLTGGEKAGLTKAVDEQYLLDIEREAFVSLAGEKLSQDRISFMLKKGKPLRN